MNAQPQALRQGFLRSWLAPGGRADGALAPDTTTVFTLDLPQSRTPAHHPLQPLLERIETELERGLIVLPPIAARTERARRALLELADDEALADALAGDAHLAVRLLAFANAPPHARGGRALGELLPAVRRIGHLNVVAIVHAHVLAQLRHSPRLVPLRPQLAEHWTQATTAAAFARRIAWRCGADADLAFLCGLLHNSGRLYLLVRCAQMGLDSLLAQAAPALLWRWQARLGAALVRAWELPAQVGRTLARQARLGGYDDAMGAITAAAARAVAGGAQDAATATLLAQEAGLALDAGQWRELMARSALEAHALRVLLGD